VLTMVESSVCMKKPVATSHNITDRERGEGVGLDVVLGSDMGRRLDVAWRGGQPSL
jgi:hypothetical protein